MSTWTTKALDRDREYIVIKHQLRNVNYQINGIRFRDGFAVVEKDSKAYYQLKKIPLLKNAQELPLSFLKKLPFITRAKDVEMVYGKDVYYKYINSVVLQEKAEKVKEEKEQEELHLVSDKCKFRIHTSRNLCKNDAITESPSGYCRLHVLQDPRLEEFEISVPKAMDKKERRAFRKKLVNDLGKLKKQGKF